MSYYKRVLIILGIVFFYILAFVSISNLRLLPTNVYSKSADSAINTYVLQGGSAYDVTFADIFKRKPYCLIDPTCVNFITNDGMALWQYESRGSIGLNKFALPNALLFLLVVVGVLYAGLFVFRGKPKLRCLMIVFITVFASIEIIRWFAEIEAYESSSLMFFLSYVACIGFMLSTVWLVVHKTKSRGVSLHAVN